MFLSIVLSQYPMVLLILFGAIIGHFKLIKERFVMLYAKFLGMIILPLSFYHFASHIKIEEMFSLNLYIIQTVAMGVPLLMLIIITKLMKLPLTQIATITTSAIRPNIVFFGVPVLILIIGEEVVSQVYAYLIAMILFSNFFIHAGLNMIKYKRVSFNVMTKTLRNPMVSAIIVGLMVSASNHFYGTNIDFSPEINGYLSQFIHTFTLITLIMIGYEVSFDSLLANIKLTALITVTKLIIQPLIALATMLALGMIITEKEVAAILLYGAPIALIQVTVARIIIGDSRLASEAVTMTIIVAFIVSPLLYYILHQIFLTAN